MMRSMSMQPHLVLMILNRYLVPSTKLKDAFGALGLHVDPWGAREQLKELSPLIRPLSGIGWRSEVRVNS